MNREMALTPFGRYVRLYTLHQVEQPVEWMVLRVRIETLHYSFQPLHRLPLDDVYASEPREGASLVRATILPRLQTLLDSDDPFEALGIGPGREALWERYAATRGLPVRPVSMPGITPPPLHARLPARSATTTRLARLQHALEMVQTAAETAQTLAAVWQNWQIGRERIKLLGAQRTLLQDAIQAQLAGQTRALDQGLDPGFVQGYLAAHGSDEAIDVVFDE